MKNLILVIAMTMASTQAFAKDSLWMICKGETAMFGETNNLVVNVFEHRNSTGDGRETSLVFLLGGWNLTGNFNNTDSDAGAVQLQGNRAEFKGHFKLNYGSSVEMNGALKLANVETMIDTVLKCEVLSK